MKTCSVVHCEKQVTAKGLCKSHYRRQQIYGNPLEVKQVQHHGMTLRERFFMYVKKQDGCWEWLAGKDDNGYGKINVEGVPNVASRVSWLIHYGDIPIGMCVCHKCDNPSCTNPDHLFIGTQMDNINDMHDKGRARQGHVTGSNHHNAKITDDIVRTIRKEGNTSQSYADGIGLSRSTVHAILKGKTWAHVEN